MINRDKYLNDLIIRQHNKLVKVITGLKAVGKTYLLFNIFKEYLLKTTTPDKIIELSFDNLEDEHLQDPLETFKFIKSKIITNDTYYILLDEVQMLHKFEKVLNSLLKIHNVDIYVTGSNSKFLSKDIITEFRGRSDEIHILPLTFKEFYNSNNMDINECYYDYINFGGLPLILSFPSVEQKQAYLKTLFIETYIKDIKERYDIQKEMELDDLINILSSSIGSLTNPTKIKKTFESVIKSDITLNTINLYLTYLEDCFLINKVYRYDVKGRKYIGTPLKYYFEDIGLRNARLNFRQIEETHIIENIVYNELRYRGFTVDIGNIPQRELADGKSLSKSFEIDFIAHKNSNQYYIQVAYTVATTEKLQQERKPLLLIRDSFPKVIIVKDQILPKRDDYGILYISLFDFLLKDMLQDF